ncbi:phytoene/squalene synthase family protein [Hydrogenophaga sp.]|uniref:phytoene/squalene synthase family protein n=1 Tax=Hydrogenophaga sp. TaxID=1904254 RepID=UPI002AB9AD6A|nr:phytoene/squalene synthase family protein [Hydrogenophaga sp.]MDZ4396633.1 phytoene/squalene synthase family protein [Hydrogenophaga sp.]
MLSNTLHAELVAPRASADLDACVALMRTGSKTFFAASRLLPVRVRASSIALYAFCRVADDMVDGGEMGIDDAMRVLTHRLDCIYAGDPQAFVEDRALSVVVQRHALPRPLLDALLDGFAWDAQARRYDTLEQVHDYGARVAGSVGAMMCWIMGVRSPQALARACELGVAMQLTNIARDVGEDARNGRLYLPREWMAQAGIDTDAWLRQPLGSPALQGVVSRLLDEADRLYAQATAGIAQLPRDCRSAILAARLIYAEIGQQLRRDGLDPCARRAVVPASRKLVLLACASLQSGWMGRPAAAVPPLAAIAYLVDQCHTLDETAFSSGISTRPFNQRLAWMLDMFERVEARRQDERHGAHRPVAAEAGQRLSH